MIKVICQDAIGLTIDLQLHSVEFELEAKYKYNDEKIKLFSIQKINDLYNPKYPYFFSNITEISKSIDIEITYSLDNIDVLCAKIYSKYEPIYKISIHGLSNEHVYMLGLNNTTIQSIIKKLYPKYSEVYSCIFKYLDNNIGIKLKLFSLGLKTNCVNELKCIKSNFTNIRF